MHQQNQTPNRVAFAEVLRQLKEATGALDTEVMRIHPISLRREWVVSMTRIAATMTNHIWERQEDGETGTEFFFTIDKYTHIPMFGIGEQLRVVINLDAIDTPVKWTDCVWQPPSM